MRCPKCGSFLEDGKTVCFMCGANITEMPNVIPENQNSGFNNGFNSGTFVNPGQNQQQDLQSGNDMGIAQNLNIPNLQSGSNMGQPIQNNTFGNNFAAPQPNYQEPVQPVFSGMNQNTQDNSGFNSPQMGISNSQKKQVSKEKLDDYKKITINDVKQDKDMFDFFSEHKKGIKISLIIVLVAIVGLIGFNVIKKFTSEPEKEAVYGNLYYKINDEFTLVSESSSAYIYTLSGDKGSDCSISITKGTTTSGDHASKYFQNVEKNLEPETDKQGNIIDELQLFDSSSRDEPILNQNKWSRMYVKYRPSLEATEYTQLRYTYLSAMYKGYYYDIELVNNSNSNICTTALDEFTNSLQFVEKEAEKK